MCKYSVKLISAIILIILIALKTITVFAIEEKNSINTIPENNIIDSNKSIELKNKQNDNKLKIEESYNTNNIENNVNVLSNDKRTIEDGIYVIRSSINPKYVLDVNGASKGNGANVQLYEYSADNQKRFKVKYLGDGFYSIVAVHSNKAIDVKDASKQKGANVWQWEQNGTDAQKWIIKDAGNGYYSLISKCNGLYMDVTNASASNFTNIQMCDGNGLKAQKFKFEKYSANSNNNTVPALPEGTKTIEDGTYVIKSSINQKYVLDVNGASKENGANVQLYEYSADNQKRFKVKYLGDGFYSIVAVHSNKAIDVKDASKQKGANVWQWEQNGTDAQKWIIKEAGNGFYSLISKCNGLYMDVTNASASNFTNIQMCDGNGLKAQKFIFENTNKVSYLSGNYGMSGLKLKVDPNGTDLKYYKIGSGPNVFFATFAIHGWEDDFNYDGQELTKIANAFRDRLISINDIDLANKWTIYILPSVNPDGEYYGWSHNGPGRTTLYSDAPNHKGIDMNRTWSTDWVKYTSDRNYTGTEPFQAYEARFLRDFLLSNKSIDGQTILVDLHGWLNETMGDYGIGSYYRSQLGMSKHISSYGRGYLINWARANLGSNGRAARTALIELPEAYSSADVSNWGLADKYINATINMLRSI